MIYSELHKLLSWKIS